MDQLPFKMRAVTMIKKISMNQRRFGQNFIPNLRK